MYTFSCSTLKRFLTKTWSITFIFTMVAATVYYSGAFGRITRAIQGNSGLGLNTCDFHFGSTPDDDLAKIDSYHFEGIQHYIDHLFPTSFNEPVPTTLPVFVTAFSSNHFVEGVSLLINLKETVRQRYENLQLIIYDLGLSSKEIISLTALCSCEIRKFPFHEYPTHLKNLKNYAWKTIVIQNVAKEHPFVFWMDASVRFKTSNLDGLFEDARRQRLMVHDEGTRMTGTISERTHKATFDFLQENPCTYANQAEKEATLIILFANRFITRYFLKPWVSCALVPGCMVPVHFSQRLLGFGQSVIGSLYERYILSCPGNPELHQFHLCHRFDQSVLGILHTRLFHRELKLHTIDKKYFMFCKSHIVSESTCVYYG